MLSLNELHGEGRLRFLIGRLRFLIGHLRFFKRTLALQNRGHLRSGLLTILDFRIGHLRSFTIGRWIL